MTQENDTSSTLRNGLPPPPVPKILREMLKDYPEHIERLQQVLNHVMEKPLSITPRFERAIWALEGRLETFVSEARAELKATEAGGDPEAIEKAEKKALLMGRARSGNGGMRLGLMDDLWNYIEANKEAFK